ncbi:MAG: VWA domain-containing protein, partial [Acidobacteriota bacterium]
MDKRIETFTRAHRFAISCLVLSGLLLASASSAHAEEVFFETVDVERVNVEIWARDADGEPVSGLTPEDFEIRHDGDVVTVTNFTEFRAGRPVRALAGEAQGETVSETADETVGDAEPSHLIIYFDQLRIHPNHYEPLTRDLEEFLASGRVDPGRVLILRQDRQLFVAANFGSNLRQLRKALADIRQTDTRSFGLTSGSELALDELRRAWQEAQTTITSRGGGLAAIPNNTGIPGDAGPPTSPRTAVGGAGTSFFGRDNDACGLFLDRIEPIIDGWAHDKSQRLAVSLEHLTRAGTFLAGLSGVKTFLYLSDGFELQPASALASFVTRLCPTGQTSALSSATDEVSRTMTRLTRHLNTNQVTVYSLQAGGLEASPSLSSARGGGDSGITQRADRAFETAQRASERDGLSLIARETGGRAVFNQNSLSDDLTEIGRDMGTYYSLAYAPPPGESGVEHRIEVRVPGKKVTTRYRRGYLAKDADRWMTERLEGALNLGL